MHAELPKQEYRKLCKAYRSILAEAKVQEPQKVTPTPLAFAMRQVFNLTQEHR